MRPGQVQHPPGLFLQIPLVSDVPSPVRAPQPLRFRYRLFTSAAGYREADILDTRAMRTPFPKSFYGKTTRFARVRLEKGQETQNSTLSATASESTHVDSAAKLSNPIDDTPSALANGYMAASQSSATAAAYALDEKMFRAAGGTIPASPRQIVDFWPRSLGNWPLQPWNGGSSVSTMRMSSAAWFRRCITP